MVNREESNETIYNEIIHFLESNYSRQEHGSGFVIYSEKSFSIIVIPILYTTNLCVHLIIEEENGIRYYIHEIKIGERIGEGIKSKRKKLKMLENMLKYSDIIKDMYKKSVFLDSVNRKYGHVQYMNINKHMRIEIGTSSGYSIVTSDITKDLTINIHCRQFAETQMFLLDEFNMDYDSFMSMTSFPNQ